MSDIVSHSFEAIGTHWQIDISSKSADNTVGLFEDIMRRVELFDHTYSRFRSDSLVAQMAAHAGRYVLPTDAKPMMDLYEKLYRVTDGLFTPLIGGVLSDAGYDATYSLQPKILHQPPVWNDIFAYDFPILTLAQPALLDFGGVGKGYLIDIIGGIIQDKGIPSYTIDAGGDIFHFDSAGKLLQVGLEHPINKKQVIGVMPVINQSICCSAGNRRSWAGFHHIINPHTLQSPHDIAAAWVIAPTALIADALATCLFLISPSQLEKEFSFEYLIMYPDQSIKKSSGFTAELFTS